LWVRGREIVVGGVDFLSNGKGVCPDL
jgi:hypothetical protein